MPASATDPAGSGTESRRPVRLAAVVRWGTWVTACCALVASVLLWGLLAEWDVLGDADVYPMLLAGSVTFLGAAVVTVAGVALLASGPHPAVDRRRVLRLVPMAWLAPAGLIGAVRVLVDAFV